MSLRLFACVEGAPTLWEFDDPASLTDAGTVFTPLADTHPIDFGPARGFGKLVELMQWLELGATATLRVEPVVDGRVLTEQAYVEAFDVVQGIEQRAEAPFDAEGTRLGVRLTVPAFSGLVELGEADVVFQQRQSRSGRPT
jgi:hypothetical protein